MNERNTLTDAYEVWVAALDKTYRELLEAGAALVPNLLGATIILVLGWLLALLLRKLIMRLATGLDRLFEGMRVRTGGEAAAAKWPVSRVIAVSVYWLVIVFFVTVAADLLGLAGAAELISAALAFLPSLLVTAAVLFVFVALSGIVSGIVRRRARNAGLTNAYALGALARAILVAMAVIIALGQLGLDTTLLVNVFTLIAAAFLGGAALAFGLGARDAVRNVIAGHQARRAYRVGQRVRLVGEEGVILEFAHGAVLLETDAGRTLVPARMFQEQVSVLLDADNGSA